MTYLPHGSSAIRRFSLGPLEVYTPAQCCFCIDHLDDATFTFISTVSIAVTCSLYPAIHTIFLLLTQPYRQAYTLDTCFQISFYFSLVYMHPKYMILDLNLMPPSQSKHSFLIWNANTFQFFIVHEVKGLGLFSILVQVKLGHFNFTK